MNNHKGKLEVRLLSELKMGPNRGVILPEGFILRVIKYKEKLKEVETLSLEETIDSFQRDLHPENELEIWEGIAEIYETNVDNKWKMDKKMALFKRILCPPSDAF